MNARKCLPFLALAVLAATGFVLWQRPVTVSVIRPQRGMAVQTVFATGTVESAVMLPLAPRQGGRLAALFVDEGQTVKADDLLARLEDDDLEKTYIELATRAELARKEYSRRQALVRTGTVSQETLDKALAEFHASQAAAERARVDIDYMKLIAPADGIVIRRDGEIGEFIPAAQPLLWLAAEDRLRIDTEIDEEDIPLIKSGQNAVISADAFPGQVFHGTVSAVTPKGNPVSRSFRVRIDLPAATPLLIGMTVETNIIIREDPQALLVPVQAVSGGTMAFVRNDNITIKPVTTGAQSAETMEIRAGLHDDDIVVYDPGNIPSPRRHMKFIVQPWNIP